MSSLNFTGADTPVHAALSGQYSIALVVLSILIAVLAAYASFSHVDLMRSARTRLTRIVWHVSGAVAMGVGVWTMHFTGMVAFRMPVEISYDLNLTLTSVLPAILAGFVTLNIISQDQPAVSSVAIGGLLMGAGIGAMHYTGMGAMVTSSDIHYNPWLFTSSIGIAVLLATLALATPRLLPKVIEDETTTRLASALLMGLAISGMHYVAMGATVFLPGDHPQLVASTVMDQTLLASLAVLASLIILGTSTTTAIMRNRLQMAELETERSEATQKHMRDRFRKIVSRLPGMVYQFRLGPDGTMSFPYASNAIRDIYGVEPEAVQQDAMRLTKVIHSDDLDGVFASIRESAETLKPWQHEYRVRKPDRSIRWLQGNALPEREPDGSILWNGFIMDVTERRKSEDIIHQLAFYDALTGLPNRRLLLDRLQLARVSSRVSLKHGALLFIDLDDFKRLNDTLGHSTGDRLLKVLAQRLRSRLVGTDTVARLGGDEFVVILENLDIEEHTAAIEAERMAEKLRATMTQSVQLGETIYRCTASIGICLFTGERESTEELLRRADVAMYQAKTAGRNAIHFFDPSIHAAIEARFRLEAEFRAALDNSELLLFYQAQVNRRGEPCGAEALVRWQHPSRGLLGPAAFINMAEETGLIAPMGDTVLRAACQQLSLWGEQEAADTLSLAVNISARQFHQPDFVNRILTMVDETGANPRLLKLELTESLILTDLDDSVTKMRALRAAGIRFAMDDFGTGYSSLAYLSRLPFDEVKIDQAFIRQAQLDTEGADRSIVEAIIGLTHSLGMRVVAEGVETPVQREFLLSRRCDVFQGYLFSHPEPVTAFEQTLETLRKACTMHSIAGGKQD